MKYYNWDARMVLLMQADQCIKPYQCRDKSYRIISIGGEKAFDKLLCPLETKNQYKIGYKYPSSKYLKLYKKSAANI